jgi:hypothetical protein
MAVLAPMPSASEAMAAAAKRGLFRKQARAVASIANEVAQPPDGGLVANGFRCLGEPSRPQARLPTRVSPPQSVLFGHFKVET